ncbi:YdeI/OmpD-associated family protein [Cystobacter fuscus]|uniref:YdeI/OmpD-associated family protein n=1 Tax=Cystobacter fuscus TaxID=43 RepID=UPI001B7F9801|nr:YdeI/OmpD-associated family protein [Cystobacter fuscus]
MKPPSKPISKPSLKPTFFATPADWRAWLEKHHEQQPELLVGFYKRDSGRPSITWPESVDQALCFGWIDGVRKRLDEHSYTIRFTPRKPRSIWSSVNIQRVRELTGQGLMRPAGLRAFEARSEERSGIYSHEQKDTALPEAYDKQLKANKKAWSFFQSQAPWYQRAALHWITSAKKEETRLKRLATLLQDSAEGRTVHHLTRTPPAPK